jgi:tetratricopeptide (TPR) repeat protein
MEENSKYRKTIESLKKALTVFPDDARFHFALAGAYFLDHDYPNAWEYARKAQALGFPDIEPFLESLREVSEEPAPQKPAT